MYRYFFIYTFIQGRIYLIYVLGLLKQTKTSSTYDIEQSVNGKYDNQIYILHIFKHDGNTHLNLYQ